MTKLTEAVTMQFTFETEEQIIKTRLALSGQVALAQGTGEFDPIVQDLERKMDELGIQY